MINLKSKTQQTQQASALAYGVGLPTSDGGAGAAANALRTVAGSAAHIGNVIKTREDAVQKASSERVSSLVELEYESLTAEIDQATKLGQWDKVKRLKDERTAWSNSIDPNSETYRTPDKHPELNNDHSSSLTQDFQNRVARDNIRIRSNLSTAQLFATTEQMYDGGAEQIKDAASGVSDGTGVPAHSVQSLMARHRDAFVATSEHESEVLSGEAQKVQDTQLTHFTEVFVMGQKYSSDIVATKASIPVFLETLEKNKDLYSEGVYKQVVGSLNKLNAEVNKPNSDAVAQATNAIKNTQTDLSQTPTAMRDEDAEKLVDVAAQSLELAEWAPTAKAREAHLSKAHWAETMFKFRNPETVQALLDWRDSNPTGSSIPFLETLENFNSGRLAKNDMTKLTQYADGLVTQANKNKALYGERGVDLVTDAEASAYSATVRSGIKAILDSENTNEDKSNDISEYLVKAYPQEIIPPNQGYTSFEGVEIIHQLVLQDESDTNLITVSQAFSNLWGRDKTAAFTLASQNWESSELKTMGMVPEIIARTNTDPATVLARFRSGIATSAKNGQSAEMGTQVDLWRAVQKTILDRNRSDYNSGSNGYGYITGIINSATSGGSPESAKLMETYVRGIMVEQVRANPDLSAKELVAIIEDQVAKDVTIVAGSDGHHQVLWTKTSQASQDYVSSAFSWVDFYAGERITKQEHADVRLFNALDHVESNGNDLVTLLMGNEAKNLVNDGSAGAIFKELQGLVLNPDNREIASPLYPVFKSWAGRNVLGWDESSTKNKTLEEFREYLTSGYHDGNKIIRLNPLGGWLKGQDVRSFQVWSPQEDRYVDVKGSDGTILSIPEEQLERSSNNTAVRRMNYINGTGFASSINSAKSTLGYLAGLVDPTVTGEPLIPSPKHPSNSSKKERAVQWDLLQKESATNFFGSMRRGIDEVN